MINASHREIGLQSKFFLFRIVWCLFFIITVSGFVSCHPEKDAHTEHGEKYTCPMHPQIVQDAPGTCPICKMDLVRKEGRVANKNQLVLSAEQIRLADIKTQEIRTGNFKGSKVLNARIVANPEAEEIIASRYPGRIEKLFVKEDGVLVSKGQALYQIYSEEMQALQLDYLLQLKQSKAFPNEDIYSTLKKAARNKLQLYGFTNRQILSLEQSGKTTPLTMVYASASGTVRELNIVEGSYVQESSVIMRIQDLSKLWVEADIYPEEAALIKQGSSVSVMVEGMPEINARIDFISPAIEANSQLLKARINISNNGLMQPGMHTTVSLVSERVNQAVLLPVDAVIREEKASYVWVKTANKTFEQRKVQTGMEDENSVVIARGLDGVKDVVISGAYLLQSELQLK